MERESETARLNDEANAIMCAYESMVKPAAASFPSLPSSLLARETAFEGQSGSLKENEISEIKSQRDALNEEINALHMTYLSLRANADVGEKELKESAVVAAGLAEKCREMAQSLDIRRAELIQQRDAASSVLLNCNKELMHSQERISNRVCIPVLSSLHIY